MSKGKWAMVLVVVAVVALLGSAFALELEGTPPLAWRQKPLPPPSEVTVVVLPFWFSGTTGRPQAEMVRGTVLLNLQRHGFRLAPAARTLAEIARATDRLVELVEVEPERRREPGVRLDRELAIQVGRKAGADWVIYGGVENLRTDPVRFLPARTGTINMLFVFASVSTDEWFDRQPRKSEKLWTFWRWKGAHIEREMARRAVEGIFQDLVTAFPPQSVEREVREEDIAAFVQAMGQ